LPQLIELQKKFPHDLQILGINSNDPDYPGEGFANMKKFAKDFEINFPYVFDETQEVAKAYKATCTPDPFLFDENRKLVYHGRISDALSPEDKPTRFIMEENVEKLLSGEKIEKEFDYSIGCSIKWIK
jgi:peroxiredoxin